MNISDLVNPYSYIMQLRRLLYKKGIIKSESVSIPVISIGNLSMGGTGKTPITLYLAKYCITPLGKKTAIVLRGYKRNSSGYLLVSNAEHILENVERSGDEAQLYAQGLPGAIVICDEDRVRGAKKAVALGAEIILLDDGFQHLRLKRDLNILLINSDEGIPSVLPFGKGREPASAIGDADIIIGTGSEEMQRGICTRSIIGLIGLYKSDGSYTESSVEIFQGKKILALSGIAHPERFLKSFGPNTQSLVSYSLQDHVDYNLELLGKIIVKAKSENCEMIATTTKDAVKMLNLYRAMQQKDASIPPLAIVHSEIKFTAGKELLFSKIDDLFKK